MDFRVKERIFLLFLCLSLGTFGDFLPRLMMNTVGFYSPAYPYSIDCPAAKDGNGTSWRVWPVGAKGVKVIKSGNTLLDPDFYTTDVFGGTTEDLLIKFTNTSTAGVYTCDYDGENRSAQFIFSLWDPSCRLKDFTKPVRFGRRRVYHRMVHLSCMMGYAANVSYVLPTMKWSLVGSKAQFSASLQISTSEDITTAVSSIDVPRGRKKCIGRYKCTATFGVARDIPPGFATNAPDYKEECTPIDPLCAGVPTENPSEYENRTDDPIDYYDTENDTTTEEPTNTTIEEATNTTTGKTTVGLHDKTDKSREPSHDDDDDDDDDDESDNSADGLLFRYYERYIPIKCVVGILGLLLVNAGTT